MLKDFLNLLFPITCASCGKSLLNHEQSICTYCRYYLPSTNFHLEKDNPVEKLFWGRTNLHSGASCYLFAKGGLVQNLIHELKYKGNKDVGLTIGKWYGFELLKTERFNTVDIIIPVPLHPRKKKKRGYNQSEFFAEGLSQSMKTGTDFYTLYRSSDSESQTRKSRYFRWKNVDSIFQLKDDLALMGKHILLVDDVITTGSTLEACIQTLLKVPNVKVSVVTIAFASH